MSEPFVPTDFEVPVTFDAPRFHLEPLDPVHNERDYQAWTSSTEHIKATPGMDWRSWPRPMTLQENMADMEMHAKEFTGRESFTYSILDGDMVIGCVYIDPTKTDYDAAVRSWVTESRSEMDTVVWKTLSSWLATEWPFRKFSYTNRT